MARNPATEVAVFSGFPEATFRFLKGLTADNSKAWFAAHRDDYEQGYVAPAKALVAALGPPLRKISPTVQYEPKVNGSLFRINRDVRFSKDKSPYKNHLDLWFWHGAHRGWSAPGFFFRLFADRVIVGGGMHQFEKPLLDRYRQAVVAPRAGAALEKAIAAVAAAGPWTIGGASRKTVPRGFDPDHPRAALLRHEGLWAERTVATGKETRSAKFAADCLERFAETKPLVAWLLTNVAPGPL